MVAMTMSRHGVPIGRKDPKLTAKRFSGISFGMYATRMTTLVSNPFVFFHDFIRRRPLTYS